MVLSSVTVQGDVYVLVPYLAQTDQSAYSIRGQ